MKKISSLFLILILISNPLQVFAQTTDVATPITGKLETLAEKAGDTIRKTSEAAQKKTQELISKGEKAISKGKVAIQKAKDTIAGVAAKAQKIKAKYAEMEGLLAKTTATATKIKSLTNDIADFPSNSLRVIKSMEEECSAKVKRITQNAQTIANSDISNLTNSANAAEMSTAGIEDIQSACVDGINKYVADRETELNNLLAKVDDQQKDLENLQEDYEKLYNEVTGKKGKEKKDKKENAKKLTDKFFKVGEIPTPDLQGQIDKLREEAAQKVKDETAKVTAKVSDTIYGDEKEADSNAAIANTMPGMSGNNLAITEAITAQTLMLKSYVDVMVMGLKLRLANNLAASKKYTISNPDRDRNIMDLANYMYPPPANLLEMAGEIAANAQETVGEVTDVATTAQNAVDNTVDEVKDKTQSTVYDMKDRVENTVGEVTTIGEGE